jgi:hypothetical protein
MSKLGLSIRGRKLGGGGVMAANFMETLGIADDATTYNTGTGFELTGAELWTAIGGLATYIEGNSLQSKIVCLHPYIGGTATYHKYNLIDPTTFELSFFGGITHDGAGVTPNGTNAYADTGITSSDLTLNAMGWNVYSRTDLASTGMFLGATSGSHTLSEEPKYPDNNKYVSIAGGQAVVGVADTIKNQWSQRYSSTNVKLYREKVLLLNKTAGVNATSLPSVNFYYYARNLNGTSTVNYSSYNQALTMVFKDTFSDVEREGMIDAINTFQLAMLRNV